MKIETERLCIIALTPEQLELWTNDTAELEKQLSCSYKAEPMEGLFRELYAGKQIKQKKTPSIIYGIPFGSLLQNLILV